MGRPCLWQIDALSQHLTRDGRPVRRDKMRGLVALIVATAAVSKAPPPEKDRNVRERRAHPKPPPPPEKKDRNLRERRAPPKSPPPEGNTVVRFVVLEPPARPTQFCVGELVFYDSAGRAVAATQAEASSPRKDAGFAPRLAVDGRLHHDFCSELPTGWVEAVVAAPPGELAAYRVGSDCGEDTPTDWRLEYCVAGCLNRHGRRIDGDGVWEAVDERRGETWAPGCDGEWREYAAPRWRVLRVRGGLEPWCLSSVEVLGARGAVLPVGSVRVVSGPNAAPPLDATSPAFADRAARVSNLISAGRGDGNDWCSDRDTVSRYVAAAAPRCAERARSGSWCHTGVALGTDFESPERCAAAAVDRCVGSSRIQWHKSGDGRCGCCTADDTREYNVDEWDVYEHGPCAALTLELKIDDRAAVVDVRARTSARCGSPPPPQLTVEGCKWDRHADGAERLAFGGCRAWEPLARREFDDGEPCGEPRWVAVPVPAASVVTRLPVVRSSTSGDDFDRLVGAVGVARGPGLPAVSAAPVDLGNWEWATKPDGVALRRIKLTTGHLDDFSRLSRHRVVSATFARNVSGDSVLGRGQPGGNVINLRI